MWNRGDSVDKSIQMMLQLAEAAFEQDKTSKIPLVSWLTKMVKWYVRDGRYRPDNLESILQSLLGRSTTMQDCSYATGLGAKLLVLAATVLKTPSCHLFTNYNKPVQNNLNPGKCHIPSS